MLLIALDSWLNVCWISTQLFERVFDINEVVCVCELDSISIWDEESELELKSGSIEFELGKFWDEDYLLFFDFNEVGCLLTTY